MSLAASLLLLPSWLPSFPLNQCCWITSLLSYLNYICPCWWICGCGFSIVLKIFNIHTTTAVLKADVDLFMNCVELTALNVFCTVGKWYLNCILYRCVGWGCDFGDLKGTMATVVFFLSRCCVQPNLGVWKKLTVILNSNCSSTFLYITVSRCSNAINVNVV